ncbi:tyrosine-type recombinase/integrase [Polaribacter sp. R2A056_3_33]|uniref:tyrosine-type recombinase/integrase n=1 Tax=unclassified Polaribacter TaxID=196858 RepID=UPI001C4F1D76|nr:MULTISPECIES: tyrosine-type recombinase/integrase [unclassified Polaribacter]QXP63284.1 tyrosine-type recombinase/integrase [Polaribacter sp. HaHaR_3_91]QXP71252.1 tyrosine-type recombinase/integrase [Polaribacter sp. R2A056_3_33]
MSLNFLLLRTVHENVHALPMKLNYSEPKIYTGGVDISSWSKLNLKEKKAALDKPWYVYFSFRNPQTNKLKRQPNIKAGVNKLKTKRERYAFLRTMQEGLLQLLDYGFNPYEDNSDLESTFLGQETKVVTDKKENVSISTKVENQIIPKTPLETEIIKSVIAVEKVEETGTSIADCLKLTLELKVNMMNKNSYVQYKSRIGLFEKWLKERDYYKNPITFITKKVVTQYLNEVLKRTSARNRNNSRTDIASMFQILEDNEMVAHNFVRKIHVLKSVPKRNKTYTPQQEKEIYKHLQEVDAHLLLFVKFISYSILRPIEICRLKIEDVDVQDKKLYIKAKNKPVQIKIIPEILLNDLPDLSNKDPKAFLFGRYEIGAEWNAQETNKRNEFTARFKKIKDHFNLGEEYGMYGFKHTFITKLYRKFRENMSQHEAKSNLMPISGHATMVALEKYLRDIDAELPEDYSKFLA